VAVAENSLLTNLTGPERDDDRRIISGIIHMLQCGARWRDCPPEYGPYTTISNRWEHEQAIGRSRGGRTTKIHALTDPDSRPCAFHLTPGQEADIVAAPALLALAPPMCALIADKGYDGDDFRADIVNRGAMPVIPNKSNRTALHRFNKRAYRGGMSSSAASVR
jgi:transposase